MGAALLLFGGTLSDRIGARQSFGGGLALFVGALAACGLAPTLGVLVAHRETFGQGLQVSLIFAALLLFATAAASLQLRPERQRAAA